MQFNTWREQATTFECEGCRLVGIVNQPREPGTTGVVIVVGGPQYRAGSHRQFTLLARYLANQGISSIRFDYRGMGDSEGNMRNFENVDLDIRSAINTLTKYAPSMRHVAIWGLCDAASAALYYSQTDSRVTRLILLNPWVRTEAGASRARLKHYYLSRLMQRSFWKKLLSGNVALGKSVGELSKSAHSAATTSSSSVSAPIDSRHGSAGYIDRMRLGLTRFDGEVFFLLSGNDLVAQEFQTLIGSDKHWKKLLRNQGCHTHIISDANHTFSRDEWRNSVSALTSKWLIDSEITRGGHFRDIL